MCRVLRWDLQTEESEDARGSKGPKNFQTQKCWLHQCIGQLQERGSLVAHRALVWRLPAESLGFSKVSSLCLEMSQHILSLREHPEISIQPGEYHAP